jgi:hypothetical protein
VQVLDEVVHTIEPWRDLLIEGKCGSEISPAIGALVERVRREVQGDIGRLGATVDEVVALTAKLAEAAPAPAPIYATPELVVERAAPSKPKSPRPAPSARTAPASAKGKPSTAKSKSTR